MSAEGASGIERFMFGVERAEDVDTWLNDQTQRHLSRSIDQILFRAGRVDAVYGLRLSDGEPVVVKVHRPPAAMSRLRAVADCQRHLVEAGYPCAGPLWGPARWGTHVVSVESLLTCGGPADTEPAAIRAAMATSLAEQVQILRQVDVADRLAPPPAWTVYRHGPWPAPHDVLFDFTRPMPAGWEWVDELAGKAAATLNTLHHDERLLVGHADWHHGNVGFGDGRIAAVYDLDLFADNEPVIAGMAAAGYAKTTTAGPRPEEVTAFLASYDHAHPGSFDLREQRQALAAATWAIAYNARCALSMMNDGDPPPPWSLLPVLNSYRAAYLTAYW
jgi:Ser/Thr protein kinase RdoA (MazF antagonist)